METHGPQSLDALGMHPPQVKWGRGVSDTAARSSIRSLPFRPGVHIVFIFVAYAQLWLRSKCLFNEPLGSNDFLGSMCIVDDTAYGAGYVVYRGVLLFPFLAGCVFTL